MGAPSSSLLGASGALFVALACTPRPPQESSREVGVAPPPPAAPAPQAPDADAKEPPRAVERKKWRAGERVVARGKVSRTPWQHLMTAVDGKKSEYFDLSDGWQTVIYAKELPTCAAVMEVEASVLEVRGPGKRPGPEAKVDDSHVELQLDVEAARCVE